MQQAVWIKTFDFVLFVVLVANHCCCSCSCCGWLVVLVLVLVLVVLVLVVLVLALLVVCVVELLWLLGSSLRERAL